MVSKWMLLRKRSRFLGFRLFVIGSKPRVKLMRNSILRLMGTKVWSSLYALCEVPFSYLHNSIVEENKSMKPILTVIIFCIFSFQLHAQVSFILSSQPTVGTNPIGVTAADVNGDGKVDLVSEDFSSDTLTVLTNNGSGGFVTSGSYAVGSRSARVAAADVNGDGKVDLISVNWVGDTLSVLTNNGSGGFVTSGTYGLGTYPSGVAAADVNGDGKVDLIAAVGGSGVLTVLTNDGSGYFVLATNVSEAGPISVTTADVNGDGKADLISVNNANNTLAVLTNNGSGGFVTSGTYGVGVEPISVTAADVNGDGKVDLVCANYADNTLTVLTNNGSGGFVTSGTYAVGVNPESVTAADVNGDGWVDLITANMNGNTLTVLTNDGSGGFALASTLNGGSEPRSVVAADVNGDGKADLIYANFGGDTLTVLTNATPFPPSSPPVIAGFSPMAATNGASVTLAGTNFSSVASNNIVYFAAVRATVTAASPTNLTVTVPVGATYGPITETVNGLTAYSDQPFLPIFPGNGQINSSSLGPQLVLPTGSGPGGRVVIADLDGDGKPDLIIPDAYAGKISIYQNISTNGSLTAGSFGPRVDLPMVIGTYDNPYTIAVADLDGDGRLDIIALNADNNVISILRNTGSPGILTTNSFATRIDLPAGNSMRGLAVQDLNGDGKPDIVAANNGDNTISIFQNISTIGNIAFTTRVNFTTGFGPVGVAIGDFDGDGKPDLAVVNANSVTISVFQNIMGAGDNIKTNSFAPKVDFPALTAGYAIAIGDMDGDSKLDLVVGSGSGSQAISVYRNTATVGSITTNSFAAQVNFAAPGWVNAVALADLDGDGKLDIVLVSELPSVLSIFNNVSVPGSFTTASLAGRVDYSAGNDPGGIAVGDLNGDGRPDIVFANNYDNTISIYQNMIPTSTLPSITGQPQDAYVYAYGTGSFTVTATGASSYQWLFNGSNVLNATSSTLNLANVVQSELGPYSVVVANSYGAVTSSIANLYMYPSIITPFTGLVTDWGQSSTLSVEAWGSGVLTFQWYDNGVAIPNATNSTLAFSAIQFTNAGSYSVVVSSSLGSVTNTAAQVVVNPAGVSLGLYPGITVTGAVGYTYDIQSNPDLTNTNGWITVATLTLWQPVEFWVDVNHNAASPTNQHRFYRVLPGQ
jgi:hypothetical protein